MEAFERVLVIFSEMDNPSQLSSTLFIAAESFERVTYHGSQAET